MMEVDESSAVGEALQQPFRRTDRSRSVSENNDNSTTTTTTATLTNAAAANANRLRRHPSQATMWHTTVPQSLVDQKLGSRHAPTRRSLRHSRMVVLAKETDDGQYNTLTALYRTILSISVALHS